MFGRTAALVAGITNGHRIAELARVGLRYVGLRQVVYIPDYFMLGHDRFCFHRSITPRWFRAVVPWAERPLQSS